jgi:hypothetical protein
VSKDYNSEIGYESLLSDFKRYQKQTPKGLGLTRKGQNIYLQFKTPSTSVSRWDRGTKTYKGVVSAMKKLASISHRQDIYDKLSELDITQVIPFLSVSEN